MLASRRLSAQSNFGLISTARGAILTRKRLAMSTRINTSPPVKTYTLEEFWQLPDPPDRSKLELIAGVLYMTPPPEYTHDHVVKKRLSLLTTWSCVYSGGGVM